MLVALVFSGAQVMTVTGSSPAPAAEPGMTPHEVARDAHTATRAVAVSAVVLRGRRAEPEGPVRPEGPEGPEVLDRPEGLEGRRSKVRRETGMVMHDSAAAPTMV
ncbi:hypothetical protein GCM10010277_53180 [Streptomyces longisporoflavus]|nr:hypothetical protein GCM10010277_53180 [Streptomyces longisporoflavus]